METFEKRAQNIGYLSYVVGLYREAAAKLLKTEKADVALKTAASLVVADIARASSSSEVRIGRKNMLDLFTAEMVAYLDEAIPLAAKGDVYPDTLIDEAELCSLKRLLTFPVRKQDKNPVIDVDATLPAIPLAEQMKVFDCFYTLFDMLTTYTKEAIIKRKPNPLLVAFKQVSQDSEAFAQTVGADNSRGAALLIKMVSAASGWLSQQSEKAMTADLLRDCLAVVEKTSLSSILCPEGRTLGKEPRRSDKRKNSGEPSASKLQNPKP